jgi:hypothetical protein
MNMRKITSLTALLSFLVLILNSVVLYIVPQGRVSNWSDWRLWGLDKTAWVNQHIIIGVLFLVAIFLHIYYNWRPIVSYLKNKANELKFLNKDFNMALIVTIVCVIGSYFTLPPFNWVLDFGESIKNAAAVKYGDPPYGHAELSTLKTLARRSGFDLNRGMENLKMAGIQYENESQTLLAIAKSNRMSPQQVYLAMKPAKETEMVAGKPKMPEVPTGLGRMTLAEVCRKYKLDPAAALQKLAARGIAAKPDDKVKMLAEKHELNPVDIYEMLKK